jgi:hypothetical protein
MTDIFPSHTRNTTASEAVMDLDTGVEILISHLQTLAKSISESEDDLRLMEDMQPVFWLVLRLQNDIADVLKRVEALPRPAAREVVAA